MKNTLRTNTCMIALFALQLWDSTPLSAVYTLDDIDSESYQTHYNELPTVEDSDHQLQQRSVQFSQLVVDAERIVTKYEMEGNVGLRLIHSHFPVENGQLMVEELQSIKGIPSLVTYAQDFETAKEKQAFPASWIFSENHEKSPIVFETTTDPAVQAGIKLLKEKPEFMDEMGNLLRNTRFSSLLSIALLRKESLVAHEGEMYLEINETNPQKSIVQIWKNDQKPRETIQTSWVFKGANQQSGCLQVGHCFVNDYIHIRTQWHQHIGS